MQLHKPVDVAGQSIDAIVHRAESLVYLFSEIPKLKMDRFKLCIGMFLKAQEPGICLSKSGPDKSFQGREPLPDV